LMHTKAVYEGQRSSNNNQRVYILTRSAFAGTQRYAATTWSGDVAARWYDLKAQISSGTNFCLSGIPYWSMDIGGFAVEPRYEHPSDADLDEWRELNTRWYQFGAFAPIFRVHGQFPLREIYNIAPENHPAYQAQLAYNKLRYRLMPYIYSLTGMVTQKDYTIMRGLVMDFGADKNVLNINDQFMFGPAIMVNPVSEYKARSRSVYLPAGSDWYELQTGTKLSGGQTIQADAPYSEIPLYVKSGSIIPCGPAIQYTTEKSADTIRVFVYTGSNGTFTLYEDENTNYNYEKGKFATIPLTWNETKKELTIGKRQGTFNGMLKKRVFEVVSISKTKPCGLDFSIKPDSRVNYNGLQQSVKIK
jgi:alpha-D-xyloside xylohydrolase